MKQYHSTPLQTHKNTPLSPPNNKYTLKKVYGWLCVWNAVDVATYALQIAITCLHLLRPPAAAAAAWLPPLVAAQAVLLFSRLNFFSRLYANRVDSINTLKQVCCDGVCACVCVCV